MAKDAKKKRSKKLNYFDAFCQQIELATKEAELLKEVTQSFTTAKELQPFIERAHVIENEADELCTAVFDAILPDFVTPIDREDILELVNSLDDLTDQIEEVIQSFYMYDIHFMPEGAQTFAALTCECCSTLSEAMVDFHDYKKSHKKLQDKFAKVVELEDEADALYMKVIRSLYTEDRENPMRVMVWSSIYHTMEDCVDTCEGISELMNSILLKHA